MNPEDRFFEVFNQIESNVNSGLKASVDWQTGYNAYTNGEEVVMGNALCADLNNDEIAFVICHEIIHATNGHIDFIKGYYDNRDRNLKKVRERGGYMSAAILGHFVGSLIVLQPQKRRNEFEADIMAVSMMEKCGFDISASVSTLEKLRRGSIDLGIFSSHPPIEDRISTIRNIVDSQPQQEDEQAEDYCEDCQTDNPDRCENGHCLNCSGTCPECGWCGTCSGYGDDHCDECYQEDS